MATAALGGNIDHRISPVTRGKLLEHADLDDDNDVNVSGSDDITQFPRAFIPNLDGALRVTMAGQNGDDPATVDLTVNAGQLYPIQVRRFWDTGTTDSLGVAILW